MTQAPPPRSLRDKCIEVKDKVDVFLAEDPDTQILRDVQAQLRVSIEVVEEALERYRWVQALSVYIVAAHPFPEIDEFVETSSAEYNLEVARYVLSMKKGLEIYLEERPSIKAIFVGTRRTDPHGEKLTHFDPTDAGWPSFMRVHPVIDWHYGM
ncbi:hypothetical protein ACHAPT_001497 [Fusarium lateritium]